MTVKVIDQPLVTQGNAVINGPQAPIQVAAKVGAGMTLTAAKNLFTLEYIDPETWKSLGASARGFAIVLGEVQAADTLSIGVEDYTFGGEEGIAIGANPTATAANLVTALAASDLVTAVQSGATVYLTAKEPGDAGNEIELVSSAPARISVSGETLSGGVDGDEVDDTP